MSSLSELALGKQQAKKTPVRPIQPNRVAQKIINTAQKFGAGGANAAQQQATTRVIYDSLKLVAGESTTVTFFKDAKKRSYPLTNLQENKLQQGEYLSVEDISFAIIKTTIDDPTEIIQILNASAVTEFLGLYGSEMDLQLDKSTVLSALTFNSINSQFNPSAKFTGQDVKNMKSDLTIPELMTFQAPVTLPKIAALPAGFDWYMRLSFEGFGTIFSAKGSF